MNETPETYIRSQNLKFEYTNCSVHQLEISVNSILIEAISMHYNVELNETFCSDMKEEKIAKKMRF